MEKPLKATATMIISLKGIDFIIIKEKMKGRNALRPF